MSNKVFTGRQVRIKSHPIKDKELVGVCVSITDAETGELIPRVARAVITLDARDVNKVELFTYAVDEQGKTLMKVNDVLVQTATSNDPEVDITAFEALPALEPKHDGNLDDRAPHDSYHASVELQDDYALCDGSKVVFIYGGHGDCESNSIYLDPKQAFSLLSWLQQEKPTLERLAKEAQSERG